MVGAGDCLKLACGWSWSSGFRSDLEEEKGAEDRAGEAEKKDAEEREGSGKEGEMGPDDKDDDKDEEENGGAIDESFGSEIGGGDLELDLFSRLFGDCCLGDDVGTF